MFRTAGAAGALLIVLIILFSACTGGGIGPPPVSVFFVHGEGVPADSSGVNRWIMELGPGGYAPGAGAAAYTDPGVLGPATSASTDVVVLGRGGTITLDLGMDVADGTGSELAVWENGISSGELLFLELAYLEVSSDGVVFARFPAFCERATAADSYAPVDPSLYTGFAGLHPAGTGTAFDLAELSGEPEVLDGRVNLAAVRYVRIVDVVGDGSELDDADPPRPIYDPYPTEGTAGFDLNAVAVLAQ